MLSDAQRAFDPKRLWPAHPLDEGFPDGSTTLYAGAAGVFWALRYLGRPLDRVPDLAERNRREYALMPYPQHASFLMGEVAVLLLEERAEELKRSIERNLALPTLELMWGMPGTMLAAVFMARKMNAAHWREYFRRQAERLLGELKDTRYGPLWVQELYGSVGAYLGPVHGFAGHMAALLAGWEWLDGSEQARVTEAIERTLKANARESEEGVNWPALAGERRAYLVQYCHGAPGIVITFVDSPFAAPELDRLLARAGELIWRAGPLAKGGGLCHGTAGNGYAFLKLYRRLRDPLWLERARAFAMTAIEQWRAVRERYRQGRYSLWTGDLGLAIYLHDCLREAPHFPTVDVF